MPFSIGSWSFHELYEAGRLNIFGYLESLKYRYHIDHADIWTGMLLTTEDDYIQKLRQTLDEEGLTVANLAADGAHVWDDDPAIRDKTHKSALLYMDIARRLGAKTLRIDIGARTPELSEQQFQFIVNRYKEYAHMASEYGIQVGPQTHQPPAQVPQNIKRLVEAVSSPAFGIVLDVSRWIVDQEEGDEMCAPYAMHVHFDSSRTISRQTLERKVQLLVSAGYSGCWSLEYRLGGNEYLGAACDLAELRRAVYLATH